jgi:CCR4-NOT transcriptional regulation complex NOT5 subunit
MSTPTPTPNPYGPQLVAPANPMTSSRAAVPAPVSTITSSDLIQANLESAQLQNSMIAKAGGKVGGSRKQKLRHRHKRSNKHERSHKLRHRRSRKLRHRRSKRGGTNPTPRPTTTVPQFGSQHPGANVASVNLNSGAMNQMEQSKFDSLKGPSTTTYFQ